MKSYRFITLQLLMISWFLQAIPALAGSANYKENIPFQWSTQPYRFYHQVDFRFSPRMANQFGGDYRLTYSLGAQAVDLQASYVRSNWGALSVPPSDADLSAGTSDVLNQGNSQLALPRNANDSWTQWAFELGYSYRGRLIPLDAKLWMQSARIALSYSGFKDSVNSLSFRGIGVDTEASLWYSIHPKLMMGPSLGYHYGWMHLSEAPSSSLTRLPFAFLHASLGAIFKI